MEAKEAVHKIVDVDMEAEDADKEATTEEDVPKIPLLDVDRREVDTITTYYLSKTLKPHQIIHKDMDNN